MIDQVYSVPAKMSTTNNSVMVADARDTGQLPSFGGIDGEGRYIFRHFLSIYPHFDAAVR